MMASAVRVYSSMTLKKAAVPAAGGHVGLEVEVDHMHRVLGCEPFLFPSAGPGPALLPRPAFTDEAFDAQGPAHPLPVQRHAVPLGLGQQVQAGLPLAPGGVFHCDGAQGSSEHIQVTGNSAFFS